MSIPISTGSGAASVAAEAVSGLQYQQVEIYGAGGASVLSINADGSLNARTSIVGQLPAGTAVLGSIATLQGTMPWIVTQNGTVSASVVSFIAPPASFISGVTSVLTGTGLTSVLTAAGGTIKNYVTHIICTNGAATGTFVDVKDGGGNVLYSGYAAASGGGFSSHIYPPIVGSANKSVDVQPRAQASIIVAMTGYTA